MVFLHLLILALLGTFLIWELLQLNAIKEEKRKLISEKERFNAKLRSQREKFKAEMREQREKFKAEVARQSNHLADLEREKNKAEDAIRQSVALFENAAKIQLLFLSLHSANKLTNPAAVTHLMSLIEANFRELMSYREGTSRGESLPQKDRDIEDWRSRNYISSQWAD
jgi:ABC-type transport system involved in cytochrome bd biosynthesis fused ATPase/permease subunit